MKSARTQPSVALYPRIVGTAWADLSEPVQQFHLFQKQWRGTGLFTIRHGSGVLARLLVWLMRLPAEGDDVPVELVVDANENGEQWNRKFAGRPFITKQSERAGGFMAERIGLTEILYRLTVKDRALCYEQVSAALRLGRLRLPLPRLFAPKIAAREWAAPDGRGVYVSVEVRAPLAGLLIHYQGNIVSEE